LGRESQTFSIELIESSVRLVGGHAMDAPTAVTQSEERALATVARELGVEDGESWAALLRELDTPSLRA
jgi:hypothetical protein